LFLYIYNYLLLAYFAQELDPSSIILERFANAIQLRPSIP